MKKQTVMKPEPNVKMPFEHVNNPQDAAFFGGHALNESYKIPAANAKNHNPSYRHPLPDPSRASAPTNSKMIAPGRQGKNPGIPTRTIT